MGTLQSNLKVSLIDQVTRPARGVVSALAGLERQAVSFASPFRSLSGQVVAFGAAYLGLNQGFNTTYKAAADAQAALTEIGIKANLSQSHLGQMQKRLADLSPRVNQFSADLTAGVDTMLTMGLGADQAMGAIEAIGRASTATGATIEDLSSASVSAMQNLGVASNQIQQMLEGMTSAGNAGAFEAKDMASYFPQLTASAKSLGMQGVGAINDMAAALQIARRGAGDASTAANNLANFLGKIMTPETIKNFKKFGVDVTKELEKAHKKGVSPIEHFIKLIDEKTDGGKADLVAQLFGDKQVLDFVRPMLSDFKDYLKIRADADRANGAIADAYTRRMEDANQKVKAFQISLQNVGTAIGSKLLGPVADAADYLADVFNTLDKRVTVFDRVSLSVQGFLNGLGLGGSGEIAAAAKEWRDFLFGIEDGSKAADQAGRIFMRAKEWGASVRELTSAISDNPVGQFFGQLSGYGFDIFKWSIGIGLVATAVRGLAKALWLLSGASAAIAVLKGLRGFLPRGKSPVAAPAAGSGVTPTGGKIPGGRPGSSGPWGRVPYNTALPPGTKITSSGPKISQPAPQAAPAAPSWGNALKGGLLTMLLTELGTRGIRAGFQRAYGESYVEPPGLMDSITGTFNAWKDLLSSKSFWIGEAANPDFNASEHFSQAVKIDQGSIDAMVAPRGVQEVKVTNPQVPNINLSVSITNNGVNDPETLAGQVGAALEDRVRSVMNGLQSSTTY